MNISQKEYIENNIYLIENNEWEEFFKNAPPCTGEVLYTAKIDFMNHLKEIPKRSFYRSKIEDITIPNGVTIIGCEAFWNCTSLKNVTIGNSVTRIGNGAFAFCDSLTSVDIPDSITSIGYEAFSGCMSLTSINFKGTNAQWAKITLDKDWAYASSITQIICTDGIMTV